MSTRTSEVVADERRDLVVEARGMRVQGSRGVVVQDLDLAVPAGGLAVLQGPAGAGKTSALLALGGRMRIRAGDVRVAGHTLPGHEGRVRRRVALAEMAGVNDLDGIVSVSNHVAERCAMVSRRPWSSRRDVTAGLDRFSAALAAAADVDGPDVREVIDPDLIVADLSPLERVVLGAVLGSLGDPDVLLVDDNGYLRSKAERAALAAALGRMVRDAPHPMGVLVASTEVVDRDSLADTTGLATDLVQVVTMPVPTGLGDPPVALESEDPPVDVGETPTAPEPSGGAPETTDDTTADPESQEAR